ncbi:MAG: RIP metalloprotease RseP [Chromatiales bacterium]|nr:RIP metalloprotease RseP [Chromatiales bacterium]
MSDVLLSILALLVALSLLIAVHEWGHFLVARWNGVKVLRFSIGFGKPLWTRRFGPDQTEFVIAAIPLGGYVKMLDEREGEVAEADLGRAFNRQSLRKRSAIVVAGPLFNFLFALLAYWLMFVMGVPGLKPILGEVTQDTIAYQAGLREGQEILAVNGEPTPTWQSAIESILPRLILNEDLVLSVYDGGLVRERSLVAGGVDASMRPEEVYQRLGLRPFQPRIAPVLERVLPGSPAERAGLQAGDRIINAAGESIAEWAELVAMINRYPEQALALQLERNGEVMSLVVRPERVDGAPSSGRIGAMVRIDEAQFAALRTELRYGPVTAISASWQRTWEMSALTLKMIAQMITGRASLENVSGPIGIAQYAKSSAGAGLSQFLAFLGLISISLGILNLLPIPVLDGGHLMNYAIEAVRGKPLSDAAEAIAQRVGLMMILALMMLAIFNDLVRITG